MTVKTQGRTPARSGRADATREAILATAERLFAEHGVVAVSNRQISEAAGQGNTAAVGYHFGTKEDLVRAIVRRHTADVDRRREERVAAATGSTNVRDWVDCLVCPMTEHLDALGSPTWFARFAAQVMTDPVLRETVAEESLVSTSLRRALDGLEACLPSLPAAVRAERGAMVRQLMMVMPAERERALAEGIPTPRSSWRDATTGLVDAITGIWLAPVTPTP
ncbi:MAG: TetR/AcrR family transcriptional regulator [Pseudonocardia sp.]|uniref:TetR/AcrR family transcriptional regulator n=1 Tax=unclassified Pseudonocardia TaxID=2619320 RepID=UPI00086E5E38|nr:MULTISPECIES: TetR/AcrR family transcriptional regulator [unclassified Pseudonocardia]MBN9107471.1 TetR/AcrR family transcriptional regulator [Pseudonocardia sp.]ODV08517.1 MAG: TetR family transcriptional regulator [Pseudonocardia sp. SCN 73-27]